jgi:hypothetical protein
MNSITYRPLIGDDDMRALHLHARTDIEAVGYSMDDFDAVGGWLCAADALCDSVLKLDGTRTHRRASSDAVPPYILRSQAKPMPKWHRDVDHAMLVANQRRKQEAKRDAARQEFGDASTQARQRYPLNSANRSRQRSLIAKRHRRHFRKKEP